MTEQGAIRVSDAEREQVAGRLVAAHGEGRLTLVEYDERVRAAHAAVVRDDLAPLLVDLPDGADPARAPRATTRPQGRDGRERGRGHGRRAMAPPMFPVPGSLPMPCAGGRAAVGAWALVSAVNLVIWLAVSLGTGTVVHPWWIWVAGPWGLALLLGGLGRSVARPRG